MKENKDQSLQSFAKFVTENTVLVADAHSASRTRLVATLVQLGAKRGSILTAGGIPEAEQEIARSKPRFIISDYELGSGSGLDLIPYQRLVRPDVKECLFMLVTANTSQAAVARAAEEDVDSFILKPYTVDSIKKTLVTTCVNKMHPSEYIKEVEKGKDLMAAGKLNDAIATFEAAKKLNDQPSLACFYLGQAEAIRQALDTATTSYQKGLTYNKIHFKCLSGLFDLLSKQKRHAEAYEVVKRLAKYFPANPKRLAAVLKLAVVTSNFDDIEGYYRIFTQIDRRTDELVNSMCSAMLVTGKYYLRTKVKTRGLEVIEKGVVTAAGRPKFLRYAIETLAEERLIKQGEEYLKRFAPELRDKEDFVTCEVVLACGTDELGAAIRKGMELIKKGVRNPSIFRAVIQACLKSDRREWADNLSSQARAAFPSMGPELDRIFGDAPPPPVDALAGAA